MCADLRGSLVEQPHVYSCKSLPEQASISVDARRRGNHAHLGRSIAAQAGAHIFVDRSYKRQVHLRKSLAEQARPNAQAHAIAGVLPRLLLLLLFLFVFDLLLVLLLLLYCGFAVGDALLWCCCCITALCCRWCATTAAAAPPPLLLLLLPPLRSSPYDTKYYKPLLCRCCCC